jgi:hypothetical protein
MMMHVRPPRTSAARASWQMFAAPIAIALVTGVGLVAGLIGDGWLDVLAWIGLAIPAIVVIWSTRHSSTQ